MKLAISGKGGVGKSTIAAILSLMLARRGNKVLAVDCDPDANLASALGMSQEERDGIIPISQRKAMIEERTGAKVKEYGQMFKLNPEVSDIADKYGTMFQGVTFLELGAADEGGGGCACPENVLIRALVTDLVLYKDESLIMDMEAGIEHLGRATARGVDTILVVVEPGQNSIDCARRVVKMAKEINLKDIRFIANKVHDQNDEDYIRQVLDGFELMAVIPYSEDIRQADRHGKAVVDSLSDDLIDKFEHILRSLSNG